MSAKPLLSQASFTAADICVYILILGVGTLQFFLYEEAPDFLHEDVHYADLASSLLHNHSYSTNSVPEKVQPPGLPIILALVCSTLACTHNILIRTMPVFLTLGFLLSYEVIRRQRGRLTAAASCLLLAASPDIFQFVTSRLWPSFPYFFTSMLALLLTTNLERPGSRPRKFVSGCLLCLLVSLAVMIQSAGIALIGGLLGWLVLSFLRESSVAKSRLKILLPVILFAALAEVLWLQQRGNPKDWPLPGFPGGYLSQLKLKSGNYPELGLASTKDIVLRAEKNLKERALLFGDLFTRHWFSSSWASLGIAGPILLILAGLWSSLSHRESQLYALYFICYESIYLLWPWSFELLRFALPVLPLSCLYLAEGFITVSRWSRQYPRRVGALFLPLSTILSYLAGVQGWRAESGHGLQEKLSSIFWIVSAVICIRLLRKRSLPASDRPSSKKNFLGKQCLVGGLSFSPVQLLGALVVTTLLVTSVVADISLGRQNLGFGSIRLENTPEIQAARWIESHTAPNAIISSRLTPLVYHYSRRRVIWFPPITNPETLMQGIRKHHIQYVVVVDRKFSYYLPPDVVCFDLLFTAYPLGFRLVEMKGQLRIYEVLQDSTALALKKQTDSS